MKRPFQVGERVWMKESFIGVEAIDGLTFGKANGPKGMGPWIEFVECRRPK